MKFKSDVVVKLKEKVKDAKGEAVSAVLKRTGFEEEAHVRLGKFFTLEINASNREEAVKKLENICSEVLSNPVVEEYEILELKEA